MKPYFRIRFDFSIKPNFGSDLISVSNPFQKRDSQFNSTLGSEIKRSLAKFIINT